MRYEIRKSLRHGWIAPLVAMLVFGVGSACAQDIGYRGEIRLFASSYCPETQPRTEDVTGRPGVGAAPLPGMRYCRNIEGDYPSDGRAWFEGYRGQIRRIEAATCPTGYAEADGRLMTVADDQGLFWLLGWAFGGNGRDNFALPKLPPDAPNMRYCVAMRGIYPTFEGEYGTDPFIGSILVVPYLRGCPEQSVDADGRELPMYQHPVLSYLLGTSFGGRYPTFRLPDLRKFAPPNIKYCLVLNGAFPLRQW